MLQHFRKQRGQKGFTLIELLVVIAIIGILATIVLVSLNTARQKARDVRRISDMRQVALALEMFYDDNTSTGYPGASASNQWNVAGTGLVASLEPDYMTSVPDDPGTGTYNYWVAADGQSYVLGVLLEAANQALDDDLDGSVLGFACDDDVYCISP